MHMQYDDKLITLDNLGTFKGKMEGEIDKASHNLIADEYDGTKTYKVGDVVLHDGFLYECNTAIGTAEEWDPTKWTQVKVTELGGNGGVIEVEDYASLPTVGETGIIYIAKDTNKQYRWDATNGYVELSKEEEVEVYAYNDYVSFATFGEERFQKAIKGKLILYWTGNSPFYLSPMGYSTSDGGQVTFGGWRFGVGQHVDSNINKYYYNGFHSTTISRNSGLHGSFSERISGPHSVADVNENFFASNVDPVANGKRLVREMNVVGKLIPTYSSSDAGKVVRVNSSGTEVELDDTATELEVNRLFRTEYTITSAITNGSASGDESIWTKETASVTIVPEYGYLFPKTVAVSGATSSYDGSTGVVSLSAATGAVTIAGECTPLPNKGDIITLDGGTARYRVLKTRGAVAEVLAMDDVANSTFTSRPVTTTFSDGSTGQKYENSTLDNYMNSTFYSSLSANIKAAIVQKAVTQSIYQYGSSEISGYDFAMARITSGTGWYKRKGQVSVGNRYCYALDVDDVAEYLGAGSGNTVSGADLNDMFFEQTTAINKSVWLSSAYGGNPDGAFDVRGDGCVNDDGYSNSIVARPAFQVDLTNLAWAKVEVPTKGDIITIDGGTARYRVLDVSGNKALLLAMDDYTSSAYNSSSVTKTFDGGKTGQKYEGSELDTLLNETYYNSLSSNVKSAIVDQTRIQRMYSDKDHDDPSYDYHQQLDFDATEMKGLTIEDQTTVGSRHVFALDIKDIFDYLGKDTMTSAELNEMFFESTSKVSKNVWLSSAVSGYSDFAFHVYGDIGFVGLDYSSGSYVARPAFQVDLSNLSWSK